MTLWDLSGVSSSTVTCVHSVVVFFACAQCVHSEGATDSVQVLILSTRFCPPLTLILPHTNWQ